MIWGAIFAETIIVNRFEYVKQKVNEIIEGRRHIAYLVTDTITDGEYEDYKASGYSIVLTKKSGKWPYPLAEKIDDLKWGWHVGLSLEHEERFKSGDEKAIFTFCQQDNWALREMWVLRQIDLWRNENTKQSRRKIKKVLSAFADARGKTLGDSLRRSIKEDIEIYNEFVLLTKKHPEFSYRGCMETVAENHNKSPETVREICYEYREIKGRLRVLASNYRGIAIGIPKEIPSYDEIDSIIKDCFHIEGFIQSLKAEVKVYKEMRFLFEDVEYESPASLLRKPKTKTVRSGKSLQSIFKELSTLDKKTMGCKKGPSGYIIDPFGYLSTPEGYIRQLYTDYRQGEALRNHEKFEDVKKEEGLEEDKKRPI